MTQTDRPSEPGTGDDAIFEVVDPASDEAIAAMRAYFAELDERFVDGFDPGDGLSAGLETMRPANGGTFVIARIGTTVAACGGVQRHNDHTGEIKRMWVNPECRGLGLGRRMLAELERQIAELGYRDIVLDTNDVLTEAIAMYERSGYRPIEAYNDNPFARHWFTKPVADPAT